jgi:hypothetical protein
MNEQSRDRLMLSGEEELMKLIQHGFHREVQSRERDRLFQMDYLQDGWSVMDIFFVQVTSPLSSNSLTPSIAVSFPSWSVDDRDWALGAVSSDHWTQTGESLF